MTKDEIFVESGKRGENRVGQLLESLYRGKYIHNALFRYYGFISKVSSMEIDYICILKKYIYIIEVKNWNKITRYDAREDEYYVLINKNNRHFKSPIYQNSNHRELLAELLGLNKNTIVCLSVICTDDDSASRYVRDRNPNRLENSHVIRIEQLGEVIKKYESDIKVDDLEYETIWCAIERADWSSDENALNEHIEYCNKIKQLTRQGYKGLLTYRFLQCNECGGNLILGEKDGNYFGKCANFPQFCKKRTIPLNKLEAYVVSSWFKEGRIIYRMSITEYEDEIRKKQNKLKEINECIEQIESIPEYVRNMEYTNEIEKNRALNKDIVKIQMKCVEQEKKIQELLRKLKKMEMLQIELQNKYEKLIQKYEKTFVVKLKKVLKLHTDL